jgi:hypothetical protein
MRDEKAKAKERQKTNSKAGRDKSIFTPCTLLNVAPLERAANVMTPNATSPQRVFLHNKMIFGVLAAACPTA